MRRNCLLLLAIYVLLPVTAVWAQGLTGALVGSVRDEQGGALQGALVRVSSPALIGGTLTATTNEKGQLRFPVLAPGSYALAIELPPKFASYREENITIGAGATLERTVVLSLAGVAETVVVEGTSRIEARSSGFETRFGQDYLTTIPTRRFSMFDMIKAAPGVSPTSPSSGTVNTVSAFGSGVNENLFLIDGTNFTCPCAGVSRAEPSVDVIQEVQVQSIGASVEYGNIQGAVFNVITKQGGDRYQYDASYYGQVSGLTSQPVVAPVSGGSVPSSGYERERYRDFTTNLGGPVVRDRLWFFGGYQYLRDYDSQPGVDPKFPRTYEQDKLFGRLTWRLTPALQLMQSFHGEFWVNPTPPTLVTPFETTTRFHASVPSMTLGHLTHTLSSNTVWDVRVGKFAFRQKNDPSTGDRTMPNRIDQITNVQSGNVQQMGTLDLDRVNAKAVLNRYQPDWAGGDHQLRVGTEVERGEHRSVTVIPGGVRYIDNGVQPFRSVSRDPSIEGGRFNVAALFLSDSVTVKDRVTLNAGVRFDHSDAISQDIHAIDAEGRETSGTIAGLGKLYTWNLVSPRLGLTGKLTADGRTMLRASYGRFNQGVLTGELSPIHPGVTSMTTMAYSAATGGYTTLVSVVDPNINLALDPNTRPPRTDEYSVGLDREITPRLAAAVAYIRKSGSNFIAWTDVGGQYREETRTLADGRTLPVFVLTNGPAARRFLLTNPADYSLTYNGLVVALDKRRSNGWHAFGSYTFSRTSGLQASSGAAAADAQLSTVAPANTFGRDPNSLTNAKGRLPNDRPHIFRVMGTVDVPRTGFVVGGNLQYFSGKPWAASALVTLPQQENLRVLIEPRGSRRLSSQTLLDLRVSRTLGFGQGRVELLLDVLNLLNDTAEEALASDNRFSPTFGLPTTFVDPRRAMLSVRLNMGR
jgi:TonB-dependent receptor-like protein/carboxypeptidase family protein